MIRNIAFILFMSLAFGLSSPSWSYDVEAAKAYNDLFAEVKGAECGKKLHLFPAEKLVEKIKKSEPFAILDVRTPRELSLVTVNTPETLNIPLNELFTPKSLGAIPTDKPVYVICQSGIRSTAAGTALRHVGFSNIYVIKGGLKALVNYLGPKQAYSPIKTAVK